MTPIAWASLAAVFGLAIGSFLNVVIYRVPAGLSVVSPPSACPKCGHEIRNRHNVPVLGWLVLRGRCYDCRAAISARYPAVEALTGLAFGLVTLRLAQRHLLVAAVPALVLVSLVVVVALVELDGARLPLPVVLAAGVPVVTALAVAAVVAGAWFAVGAAAIAAVGVAAGAVAARRPQRFVLVLGPAALAVLLVAG